MVSYPNSYWWSLRYSKRNNRVDKMACSKKDIIDGIGQCCLCNRRWLRCKLRKWGELWVCVHCLKEREKKKNENT